MLLFLKYSFRCHCWVRECFVGVLRFGIIGIRRALGVIAVHRLPDFLPTSLLVAVIILAVTGYFAVLLIFAAFCAFILACPLLLLCILLALV